MATIEEVTKAVPDKSEYRVVGVGITYQDPQARIGPDGTPQVLYGYAVGYRGDTVSLTDGEAERLKATGTIKPVDEERSYDEMSDDELEALTTSRAIAVVGSAADGSVRREDRINALNIYDQGTGQGVVGVSTVPGGVAVALPGSSEGARVQTGAEPGGAPDALEVDTDTLAAYIAEQNLNAEETVALAKNDPARAEAVLKAEKQATTGDARKTVESRLKALASEK